MRIASVLIVSALLVSASPVGADTPYVEAGRRGYLTRALAALHTLADDLDRLRSDVYRAGRTQCRADLGAPTAGCLVAAARALCERPGARTDACLLVADVIVTNQLSEAEFVDDKTRVVIVARGEDYRAAIDRELDARYAELVVEFVLASRVPPGADRAELATGIDRFCVARAQRDVLAWQRCVAAIAWYIGTGERGEERGAQ